MANRPGHRRFGYVRKLPSGRYQASYLRAGRAEQLVAVVLIFLLTWTNTRGLELGKLVQNIFTFAKTAALIALIVIGLSLGWKSGCAALSADWWNPSANGWSPQLAQPGLTFVGALAIVVLLGKAMTGPLFAQTAWNNVTFTGSEVRDPGKNLPRSLLVGCAIVVTLYVLANVAYLATLSVPRNSTRAAKSCRSRRDARRAWRSWHHCDGYRDHDFHFRL